MVYSRLSQDVVTHKTAHVLLDGQHSRYLDPSSPDQAAFHEGSGDVVALLSVFALPDSVIAVLGWTADDGVAEGQRQGPGGKAQATGKAQNRGQEPDRRPGPAARQEVASLRRSVLPGLAKQVGRELSAVRCQPLWQSATLAPLDENLRGRPCRWRRFAQTQGLRGGSPR
jgi:hypothetical protein